MAIDPPLDLGPIRQDLAWYVKHATIGPKAIGNMRSLLAEVDRLRELEDAVRVLVDEARAGTRRLDAGDILDALGVARNA